MILNSLPAWVPYAAVGLAACLYVFAAAAWLIGRLKYERPEAGTNSVAGHAVIGDGNNVHIGDVHNRLAIRSFHQASRGPELMAERERLLESKPTDNLPE